MIPRRPRLAAAALLAAIFFLPGTGFGSPPTAEKARRMYRWARRAARYEPLAQRIPPPTSFRRVPAPRGTYTYWLRHLPLLPRGTPVRTFDGRLVAPASAPWLAAVVDLDVGRRDLQQCWDSILRLQAEYLWQAGPEARRRIRFPFGRGVPWLSWTRWAAGWRPRREGKRWKLVRRARPSWSRRNFRRYLTYLFAWTGTIHAHRTKRVRLQDVRPGDFFVASGSPGHAVMVLDLARDRSGRLVALIGQGFMPAQDFHVLAAPGPLRPWYLLLPRSGPGIPVQVWGILPWNSLRRFP